MELFTALQHELALRAAHIDHADLLRLMGYRKPCYRQHQRLQAVLRDPMLGLRNSHFDFKHISRSFVQALGATLGMDAERVEQGLRLIREQIDREDSRYVPTIFVDTGFRRSTQPIFALGVCEHQRHLRLDKATFEVYHNATVAEQVRMIGEFVKAHYREHRGRLGIWGAIQYYLYYFEPTKVLVMRPDGTVKEERQLDHAPYSRADLKLKNRSLQSILPREENSHV